MKAAAVLAIALVGCVEVGDDLDNTPAPGVSSSSRISLNGLAFDRSVLGAVADGSLTTADARAPELFRDDASREVFRYLVSCALMPNKSVTISGETFPGRVGLAPSWEKNKLGTKDHYWVTACMLARTNLYNMEIAISLRGTALPTPSAERERFTVSEGAFWGDMFDPEAPIFACAGPAKLANAQTSTLPFRDCTTPMGDGSTKCGFTYAGACESLCDDDGTRGYRKCDGSSEVLTVFVEKPE